MDGSAEAQAIREALRGALRASLIERGWNCVALSDTSGPLTGRFERPVAEEILAQVVFSEPGIAIRAHRVVSKRGADGKYRDDAPPVEVEVSVGLRHCQLARLLALTTSDAFPGIRRPLSKLVVTSEVLASVASQAAAEDVARRFSEQIDEQALPALLIEAPPEHFLEVVERLSGDTELGAAVLALMGRRDDALALLTRITGAVSPDNVPRAQQRFARHLTRWLDGDRSVPDEVPPSSFHQFRLTGEERAYSAHRAQQEKRREAINSVRAASVGRSRKERRALLREEFDRRGVTMTALQVELTLDALEVPQESSDLAQSLRAGAKALQRFAGMGRMLWRAVKDEHALDAPPWLEPPLRASYEARVFNGGEALVELDPDAEAYLVEAFRATPRASSANACAVSVWFEPDPSAPREIHRLLAGVGERHVGVLEGVAAERYRPIVNSAEFYDEAPFVRANLVELRHGFALAVPVPRGDGDD